MKGRPLVMAALCLALVSVASCADKAGGRWENPNRSEDRWKVDQAECWDLASEQAEREYTLRRQEGPSLEYNPNEPWVSTMERYDAAQRREDLFEACMLERGYQRAERTE